MLRTQWSRNLLGGYNSADYWQLDYYLENAKGKYPFRVFVADNYYNNGNPPRKIRINNSGGRLFMGYFPIDFNKAEGDHAIVFVYQPPRSEDTRDIYQKRFHMGINHLVEKVVNSGGGAVGGAVGAVFGSVIPGPGTAIGGAVGTFLGGFVAQHAANNYSGDFLRYVS